MNVQRNTFLKTLVVTFLGVLFSTSQTPAQTLTPSVNLPGVWSASTTWGDYDNDGDADLLITGLTGPADGCLPITRVYQNNNGSLIDAQVGLTGIYLGQAAWGDYDGDGDLDIALSGLTADQEGVLKIYQNNNGLFVEDTQQNDLIGVRYSALSWGDYDSDGDLDLIVSGMTVGGSPFTTLYNNHRIDRNRTGSALGGRAIFTIDGPNTERLSNLYHGVLAWADLDGDGDLDLAASGYATGGARQTRIFINQPLGTLIQDERNNNLTPLSSSDLAWGDYDNDGDLDLAISGWGNDWEIAFELYTNAAGILRKDLTFSATRIAGSLAWADYDNDGDLDLAATGQNTASEPFAFVLKNTGGKFQTDPVQTLTGFRGGDLAWADIDTDGDLDLLIAGESANGSRNTTLYTSSGVATINTPPQPPDRLGEPIVTGDDVFLNWNDGTDAQTGPAGLTYTLRIGTSPGEHNVFSGALPIGPGNLSTSKTIRLTIPLARDTYYWSVRATDTGWRTSSESQEEVFRVQDLVGSRQSIRALQSSAMAWGDYDNDGDLDLAIAGQDADGIARSLVYRNDAGLLTENTKVAIQGMQNGAMAWGDYDNDGDLDLATTGGDPAGNRFTHLYRNRLESGDFALNVANVQTLPQLTNSSLGWGDYDNDGDLDLALMGTGAGERIAQIFRNTNGSFSLDAQQELLGTDNGELAWGDYDNDGDLDLAIIGQINDQNQARTAFYQNQQGVLTNDTRSTVVGLLASNLSWGDYDNDGDLDLAITGINLQTGFATQVLSNNGSGVFSPANFALTGAAASDVTWGDYDNDGDLDLAGVGQAPSGQILHIYRNQITSFDRVPMDVLIPIDFASVRWADIDGDLDLDLISSGRTSLDANTFPPITRVNDNLEARFNPNRAPSAPAGLVATSQGNVASLTWQSSTDLGITPDRALTYALRVGTLPGGNQVLSGAQQNGDGPIHTVQYTLKNLQSGVYYWATRSIDKGFASSPWSSEESFIVDNVRPVVDSVRVSPAVLQTGNLATVVVAFNDEPAGMDNNVSPQVTLKLASGDVIPIKQVGYNGNIWIGEANITIPTPGGTVIVTVQGAKDLKNNEMLVHQEVKPARILPGSGGVVESGDGLIQVTIPPRALPTNLTSQPDVAIVPRTIQNAPTGTTPVGQAYEITATPAFDLRDPATLAFRLTTGTNATQLAVYQSSSTAWSRLGGTVASDEIRVPITQFGTFALFQEGPQTSGNASIVSIDFSNRAFSPSGPSTNSTLLTTTDIAFELSAQANVRIEIYSRSGRLQRIVEAGRTLGPGHHVLTWDGRDHNSNIVKSGLYIVVIQADGKKAQKTLAVVNN